MSARPKDDGAQLSQAPPKIHYPFWFGGSAASFAACVTHPLDLGQFQMAQYQRGLMYMQ